MCLIDYLGHRLIALSVLPIGRFFIYFCKVYFFDLLKKREEINLHSHTELK